MPPLDHDRYGLISTPLAQILCDEDLALVDEVFAALIGAGLDDIARALAHGVTGPVDSPCDASDRADAIVTLDDGRLRPMTRLLLLDLSALAADAALTVDARRTRAREVLGALEIG